jgi:hypothetical protein
MQTKDSIEATCPDCRGPDVPINSSRRRAAADVIQVPAAPALNLSELPSSPSEDRHTPQSALLPSATLDYDWRTNMKPPVAGARR